MKLVDKMGIMCRVCNDILISVHRHDFKMCKCGKVGIDGGNDYTRIIGSSVNFQAVKISTVE